MAFKSRTTWLGLGLLSGVLLFAIWLPHYRGRLAVERYRRQLLAAGEKLNVNDLLPQLSPAEENGASLFRPTIGAWNRATDLLAQNSPPAMQMVGPGKAMVGWAQPNVRTDRTNTWAEIEAAVALADETLDQVREAARRPVLDFNLDYRQGPSLLLPHLAPLKQATQRLSAAALCDLHQGHAADAGTNLHVMLALVKATGHEPLAISQLVRIAMAQIAFATTWELLQSPELTDECLVALQRDWSELDFIPGTQAALEMERALGQMTLERMRNSSAQFRQILSLARGGPASPGPSFSQIGEAVWQEIVVGTREAEWRVALSYPDQLRALKGHQVLLDNIRLVRDRKTFAMAMERQQEQLAQLGLQSTNQDIGMLFDPSGPDLQKIFSQSVVSLSRILQRVFAVETARELAITAIALKRYQLAHGQYPKALSALVPALLSAVPTDPADGNALRYHANPDGSCTLYSIGEDRVDDGGDGSSSAGSFGWAKGKDLVWPLAASPEEVSAYYQKRGKKHGP